MRKMCLYGLGILLAVHAAAGTAVAGVFTAPEIDGSSVTVGVGILAAGILLLRARKNR